MKELCQTCPLREDGYSEAILRTIGETLINTDVPEDRKLVEASTNASLAGAIAESDSLGSCAPLAAVIPPRPRAAKNSKPFAVCEQMRLFGLLFDDFESS